MRPEETPTIHPFLGSPTPLPPTSREGKMARTIWMRHDTGGTRQVLKGGPLASCLAFAGWVETEAPPKAPRKRRSRTKGYYINTTSFAGW